MRRRVEPVEPASSIKKNKSFFLFFKFSWFYWFYMPVHRFYTWLYNGSNGSTRLSAKLPECFQTLARATPAKLAGIAMRSSWLGSVTTSSRGVLGIGLVFQLPPARRSGMSDAASMSLGVNGESDTEEGSIASSMACKLIACRDIDFS